MTDGAILPDETFWSALSVSISDNAPNYTGRIARLNSCEINQDGEFVLYWMTASRRYHHNSALEHSIALAIELERPLLVVEPVSIRHTWSSDRILTFFAQGIIDNNAIFASNRITYVPWVETHKQTGNGLLKKLSKKSCAVVIDDFPTYMPRDVARRAKKLVQCSVQCIDSNGIVPMRAPQRSFSTAHSFRRYIHKNVLNFIASPPEAEPLKLLKDLPDGTQIATQCFKDAEIPQTPLEFIWRVSEASREGIEALAVLDIDHEVPPIDDRRGGSLTARTVLKKFIEQKLDSYHIDRNHPERQGGSGLSPWLHYGHISSFEIVHEVLESQKWNPMKITHPHNDTHNSTY